MKYNVERSLRDILSVSENADSLADDAMNAVGEAASGISEVDAKVEQIQRELADITRTLDAILVSTNKSWVNLTACYNRRFELPHSKSAAITRKSYGQAFCFQLDPRLIRANHYCA